MNSYVRTSKTNEMNVYLDYSFHLMKKGICTTWIPHVPVSIGCCAAHVRIINNNACAIILYVSIAYLGLEPVPAMNMTSVLIITHPFKLLI